jgi:hypothetical protein
MCREKRAEEYFCSRKENLNKDVYQRKPFRSVDF